MGLSNLVYPGAHHTRFEHAIGAMHVMQMAIRSIKQKGINICVIEGYIFHQSPISPSLLGSLFHLREFGVKVHYTQK